MYSMLQQKLDLLLSQLPKIIFAAEQCVHRTPLQFPNNSFTVSVRADLAMNCFCFTHKENKIPKEQFNTLLFGKECGG